LATVMLMNSRPWLISISPALIFISPGIMCAH
jgi:hypothetical protein